MRSAAEAKPVNSPHPRRGQRRDRTRTETLANLQNLHTSGAQPLPPTPPKSIFKITQKSDLEKRV